MGSAVLVRTGLALARSTHPAPAAAVTLVTILLGVAVGLDAGRILLLGLVMALDQVSIGLSNDAFDVDRDRAAGRADKPLAAGLASVRLAWTVAGVAAAASVLLSLPLGWPAALAHLVALAGGWAYNLGVKATPASPAPYAVSFGLLPAIATLALPEPAAPAVWAVAAGALLGVGAHFANTLPDLVADEAAGVRGLPHRLGRAASSAAAWVALVGASALVALGTGGAPLAFTALGVSLAAAVAGTLLVWRRPASRAPFLLVLVAAVADVVALVSAGPALVA